MVQLQQTHKAEACSWEQRESSAAARELSQKTDIEEIDFRKRHRYYLPLAWLGSTVH